MKMASPRAASVLLERGNIYFAYRLRVEAQTAHGFDDVQRLYVVLSPRGKASYRLIVIGQKKLPVVAGGGDRMAWGFVEEVSSRPEDVEDELDPRRYFTKMRGEREYAIARHDGHTHLGYVLELPEKPGEVQHALNIGEDGNYIVNVKNPKTPSPPGTGLDKGRRVASFPRNLQLRFRGRRFIPLGPTGLPRSRRRRSRPHRGEAQHQRARSAAAAAARDGGDRRDLHRAEDGEVTAPRRTTARGEMGVRATSIRARHGSRVRLARAVPLRA